MVSQSVRCSTAIHYVPLSTGRANAGYALVTSNCKSPLVLLATSMSRPISAPHGCRTLGSSGSLPHPVLAFIVAAGFADPIVPLPPGCVPKVRRISLSRLDYRQNRPRDQFAR